MALVYSPDVRIIVLQHNFPEQLSICLVVAKFHEGEEVEVSIHEWPTMQVSDIARDGVLKLFVRWDRCCSVVKGGGYYADKYR